MSIQIHTDNNAYITDIREYFTDYVEGFKFQPKYRTGMWNGKICVMASNRSLPYGLLIQVLKFHKKNYKDIELIIDDDVKEFFKGVYIDPNYDLNIFPRNYQIECILSCLENKSGIILSSTASGKSCIITYVIKALMESNNIKRSLIIVPTISLVQQFYSDMIEYGMDSHIIGRVYSKMKELNQDIVISTWQTLSKHYDILENFDCIICDEVHSAKAFVIKTILSKCINAKWRFGFTGTLPSSKLDLFNIQSYLGPVLRTYSAAELADLGYVSRCKIELMHINYNSPEKYELCGDYNIVKDMVFNNEVRLNLIKNTLKKADGNVLVLVGLVEKEGQILKEYLEKSDIKKEIVFIWGDIKVEEREFWRSELGKRNNIILIATYQIFQVGVNAPTLKYILFASPFKSKIRVLQSIGRALRKHESKDYAVIYDIIDNVKFLEDHGIKRMRYYSQERFDISETIYNENQLLLEQL